MNCEQGDIARIVGAKGAAAAHNGKIVRCVQLVDIAGPTWIIEPELGRYWAVADVRLRPIRDPGDDARDETLDWLPRNQPEEVA